MNKTPWVQHSIRVMTVVYPGVGRTQQGGCSCGWRGDVFATTHARSNAIRQFAKHREVEVLKGEKAA